MKQRRKLAAICAVAMMGFITSCTTLPTNTEPQALRSFEPQVDEVTDLGPTPGTEPDLLLRDFYTASTRPSQEYATARSYLAPTAADQWDPRESTLIVDRVDLITEAGSTSDHRSFNVRGGVVGRITQGAAYEPENGVYEATIEMEKNSEDEWRITSLPSGLVLERTELRNQFQPHRVFFFDQTESILVGDRRWIASDHESLDTVLIALMMEGPSTSLAPGVSFTLPSSATFAGVNDGVYQFTGFGGMDERDRLNFGAQLAWTLASANLPEPYAVEVDGAPISPGYSELTTDDFLDFNPSLNGSSATGSSLYALTDGHIFRVGANSVDPAEGELGEVSDVTAADISSQGEVGVVREEDGESVLLAGTLEEGLTEALQGDTISRPSFELDAAGQWVVVDGESVVRVIRSDATGEYVRTEVDISELQELEGSNISVLRLSNSGARVAMIINGRVYVGVVHRPSSTERKIVNVSELAPQLGGTALSLDWQPDGSLVVGTSTPESPVWRVEQDGSAVTSLPAGNITAPVVAIAASASTIYVTDARAVLQLQATGGDNAFWREVGGLQGVRSAPIVAN